jgi:hypothetical protein
MPFMPATCVYLWVLRYAAVILGLIWSIDAVAQPIQIRIGKPAPAELSAPQVNLIAGATASRLEQARTLAADKNWDEAVDIWRELAADGTERLVDLGDGRFVTLRTYCHLQIASLPAEGLAVYRQRVDTLAEQWYRDGISGRDHRLLSRVVDELFCSTCGDDALLALGELALERADYLTTRRRWEQISPLLRDPLGRPVWIALRGIDLDRHWPQVERRWKERASHAQWLAYPDTTIGLADVRARLVLTSIRAGDLVRAALELEMFRRLHSEARGRLGGQEGPYVAALERLLATAGQWPGEARDTSWPTFAGSPTRSPSIPKLGPITGPAWEKPIELDPNRFWADAQVARLAPFRGRIVDEPMPASDGALACFPATVGGLVLFCDATQFYAADLATGRPAITADGVLYRRPPQRVPAAGIAHGIPRHTLTVADNVAYGRVGRVSTTLLDERDLSPGDQIVGVDLQRDGLLTFSATPDDGMWSFDGAPLSDGRHVFVAMRRSEIAPHAYVACFDATTGGQLWRTAIGAADTPAAVRGGEITHNLLTLVGDRIYFNSNLGLVAALDAESGEVCWLRQYERRSAQPSGPAPAGSLHFDRDPAPCLYHDGLIVAAPSDTQNIFAIDADTGRMLWNTAQLPDALHLLGTVRDNLIVSGNRLWALDVRTGKVKFVWPESEHAGIRGMGRGLVAGDEVFWPTRSEIYVIHGVTGARSRVPISLGAISNSGANLAAAQGRLLVAGYDKLMAFGAARSVPPNRNNSKKNEPIAVRD